MLMVSYGPLDRGCADTCNVYVPAMYCMAFGRVDQQTLLIGATIYDFELRKADPFFVARRSRDCRDHHELDQLLSLQSKLAPLCLF